MSNRHPSHHIKLRPKTIARTGGVPTVRIEDNLTTFIEGFTEEHLERAIVFEMGRQ